MAVFDPRQGQVLIQPVTNYYRGKAIRQDQADKEQMARMRELQIEEAEYESSPERRKTREQILDDQLAAARIGVKNAELEYGANTMGFMAKALAPLTSGATEFAINGDMDGGVQFFNEGLKGALPDMPEEIRGMIEKGAGADKVYDAEEIAQIKLRLSAWGEGQGLGKKPIKFMMDGKEEQGLIDDFGNYYVKRGGKDVLATGAITPFATGRTAEDVAAMSGVGDKVSNRLALEVVGGAENLLSSVDRISTQVEKMDQKALGLPGKVTSIVDNAVNAVVGFTDMMPNSSAQIDGKEVAESALLDRALYQDMFEGAAADNAALQANAIGLAYSLARAANPDGRISDADVRHQLQRVKLSASSKAQIQSALKEVKRSILTNVSNHLRVYRYTDTQEGKAAYDNYMGILEKMDAEEGKRRGDIPADYTGRTITLEDGRVQILNEDKTAWIDP